ncbi:MAG: hypothetical protein A2030_01715 [Chloroflexi bacterium RBG_19FT_COMBO_50_10]|nr:MAG: hypothetical protein A2030_01715 [Chloroflexi bacterium RBG_19FT_COMBO_50_10]
MTKTEFIDDLQNGRRQWRRIWKGIDLFGTSRPRTPGEMSLRDILFHVAWYEREMLEMVQLRTLVGSPWWRLPVDERNTHIKTEGETNSMLQAWRLEQQVYSELVVQLQTLRDEELEDARFFQDMPSDWVPWQVIASNTFEHYAEHFGDIF